MASAFGGGGSQTAFGARAGATVLSRATSVLGALFMLGAIVLGIIGRQRRRLGRERRQRGAASGARVRDSAGSPQRRPHAPPAAGASTGDRPRTPAPRRRRRRRADTAQAARSGPRS